MAQGLDQQIEALEARLARQPGGPAFAPLADAYRRAGDLERARELVEEGLARHPAYATGHVVAGRVGRDAGDADAAAAAFRRVLELDPENVVALRNLAELAEAARQMREALRHYRTLRALDLRDPAVAEGVARLSAELGEEAETMAPEAAPGAAPDAAVSTFFGPGLETDGAPLELPELTLEAAVADEGGVDESEFGIGPALDLGFSELETSESSDSSESSEPGAGVPSEREVFGELPGIELAPEGFESARVEEQEEQEEEEAAPELSEGEVVTQTMGELYAQQGLYDRAVAVYRQLVHQDPGNEALERRLRQLEGALAGAGAGAAAEPETAGPAERAVASGEDAGVAFHTGFFEAAQQAEEEAAAEAELEQVITPAAAAEGLFVPEPEERVAGGEFDAFFAESKEVSAREMEAVGGPVEDSVHEIIEPAGEWAAPGEPKPVAGVESGGATAPAKDEVTVDVLAEHWAAGPGETGELSTPFAWSAEPELTEEDEGPPIRLYFERLLSWGAEAESVPVEALAPDAEATPPAVETGESAAELPEVAVPEAVVPEDEPWLAAPLVEEEEAHPAGTGGATVVDEIFPWEVQEEPAAQEAEALTSEPPGEPPPKAQVGPPPPVGRPEEQEGPEAGARPAEESDDDLETFRDWLKSLKE
ncbi:MAG: tetratricopeptide repeat protein [Gemmatimonadetes bacterium]|nr:tetratricopeptide repeat protein [Gemmatimonadota bacterium]